MVVDVGVDVMVVDAGDEDGVNDVGAEVLVVDLGTKDDIDGLVVEVLYVFAENGVDVVSDEVLVVKDVVVIVGFNYLGLGLLALDVIGE